MPSCSKPLVLIVDDDEATREAFSLILSLEGYRVQTASDGQDALELVRSGERPDLIVLDLMMPRLDGAQLRQRLAEDAQFADVPVVFCTAAGRTARVLLPIPPLGLLEKPVDPADLLAAVRRVLPGDQSSDHPQNCLSHTDAR